MFGFGYRISFLETSLNINKVLVTQSCSTLWDHMHYSPPWTIVLCPWDFPGKNTGMDWHFLLQGIFSTQESNLVLLHCRQILYWLSYEGSPIVFSTSILVIFLLKTWMKALGMFLKEISLLKCSNCIHVGLWKKNSMKVKNRI